MLANICAGSATSGVAPGPAIARLRVKRHLFVGMNPPIRNQSVSGILMAVALSVLLLSCRTDGNRDYALYEYRTFRVTGSLTEMRQQLQKLYKAGWTEEPGVEYPVPGNPRYSDILMMRPKNQ